MTTQTFVLDILNRWSMDIIRYRAMEIANDFGLFMVKFQDFLAIHQQRCCSVSTFNLTNQKYDILNDICDVFRLKPYATNTS